MPDPRGGLLWEPFGLTRRDVVLGSLRALEEIWPARFRALESAEALQAWSNLLQQILENMIEDVPVPKAPDRVPFYGMPTWMYQDGHDGEDPIIVQLVGAFARPGAIEPKLDEAMSGLGEKLRAFNPSGEGPDSYLANLWDALVEDASRLNEILAADVSPTSAQRPSEQPVRPLVLAARGIGFSYETYRDRFQALEEAKAASSLGQSAWHMAHESLARLDRVEIPICSDGGRCSMLLTARIRRGLNGAVDIRLPGHGLITRYPDLAAFNASWTLRDETFYKGVQNGLQASQAFLQAIGLEEDAWNGAEVELFGILPPANVVGSSAALPVALEILRQVLRLPPSPYVASGILEPRSRGPGGVDIPLVIQPLPADIDAAKARAVAADGYRRGLVRAVVAPEPSTERGIPLSPNATLAEAAQAMWGQLFDEKLQQARRDWVERQGFLPGWQGGPPQPFIRTRQADQLHEVFSLRLPEAGGPTRRRAPPSVAFLSGPSTSGKTAIARDVAERLKQEGHWDVAVLTSRFNERATTTLNSPNELKALVKRERAILQPSRRHLLIFDAIAYDERLDTLEDMFRTVAAEADDKVSFLVVRHSDRTTSWRPSDGETFGAVYSQGELTEFAERLIEQEPGDRAREVAIRMAAEKNDLRWVMDIANGLNPAEAVGALARSAKGDDYQRLRHLAYASYYEVGVPAAFTAWKSETLREGVARWAVERDGSWIIPSRAVAMAMISVLDGPNPSGAPRTAPDASEAPTIFSTIVSVLLGKDHGLVSKPEVDLDAALEVCWLLQRRWKFLATRVVPACSDSLWKAVSADGTLPRLIALLRSTDVFLGKEELNEALHALAAKATELIEQERFRAGNQKWSRLYDGKIGASELRACLEIFDGNRGMFDIDQLDRRSAHGLELAVAALRRALGVTVNRDIKGKRVKLSRLGEILRHEDSLAERLLVAKAVLSEFSHEWDQLLADSFDVLLDLPETGEDVDFGYLLACVEFGQRLAREIQPIAREKGQIVGDGTYQYARELVASIPLARPGRRLLALCQLERLRLRLGLISQDWGDEHQEFHDQLSPLLNDGDMVDIVRGIGELHEEHSTFLVRYLDVFRPFKNSFITNPSRTAAQIADLLGAISRWHNVSAFDMLYHRSGLERPVPHPGTVDHLARLVTHRGDGRDAGRLLSAALKIDELYAIRSGFSLMMVNRIGLEFYQEQFRTEIRSSILYYQVDGLLQMRHPWLPDLLPSILEHLRGAIDGALLPWTARLTMLVADDAELGPDFRLRLRTIIDDGRKRILEGMTHAYDPEGLEAYHSLARLDDAKPGPYGLAAEFAEQLSQPNVLRHMIERIGRRGRPALAARVLGVIRDTLRRAGAEHLIDDVESQTEKSLFTNRANDHEEDRIKEDHAVAERPRSNWRIRCLHKARAEDLAETLDHLTAQEPERMRRTLRFSRVFSEAGESPDILTDKVQRLRRSPEDVARLLHAIDNVRPGAGAILLSRYCRSKARKRFLIHELQFIQNPRTQARVARMLLAYGFQELAQLETIYNIWRDRVRTLRSPAALVEMLTFHRELDRALGGGGDLHGQTASHVDIDGLHRRMEGGRAADLRFLPALVRALVRAGLRLEARHLAGVLLKANLVRQLPPEIWAEAIDAAMEADEPIDPSIIATMDDAAVRLAMQVNHHDDVGLWVGLGDYAKARAAACNGERLLLDRRPPTLEIPKAAAVRLLAVRWLVPRAWTSEVLKAAVADVRAAPQGVPPALDHRILEALSGL